MAGWTGMTNAEWQAKVNELQADIRTKQLMYDRLGLQLRRCSFQYSLPERDFDCTKVIGTICSLLKVHDPRYYTALDFVAGEQLYGVVVDSLDTGITLMQKGKLVRKTTFFMLDIINGDSISRETLKVAQELGGGSENVKLALDLVSYDSKYEPAMNWVFGNTLVVRDWDTAEKLAFHPDVECRCVTEDGDEVHPCGEMTAGPTIKEPSVFHSLQERNELSEQLKKMKSQFSLLTA